MTLLEAIKGGVHRKEEYKLDYDIYVWEEYGGGKFGFGSLHAGPPRCNMLFIVRSDGTLYLLED